MGWLLSIGVGILTAVAGAFAAGYCASLIVEWYHISGREGASGYFIVLIGLLGIVAGLVIGIAVSRSIASDASLGFLRAGGISLAIVGAVSGATGLIARSLADIPPELDGEQLFVRVEIKWPAGKSPADRPGEGFLGLGSSTGSHVVRASTKGFLWLEDARQVDGRWIVPGVVDLFTRRGKRVLDIRVDSTILAGFVVPVPANPGRRDLEWSRWLPEPRPGSPPWPADQFSYRYRVARRSEPIRTETIGGFEVATIADQFYDVTDHGRSTVAIIGEFHIRHRGKDLDFDRATEVAAIPGDRPALVAVVSQASGSSRCFLLADDSPELVETDVGSCGSPHGALVLTNDSLRFRRAGRADPVRGRIDRLTFAEPGLFLLGSAVLDTRKLTVRRLAGADPALWIPAIRPLGLSPDERSFVRYGYDQGSHETEVVAVTDRVADTGYTLPVDPARMRYANFDAIDPVWLLHHFGWKRGPDGVDRLIERPGFTPLPYQGVVAVETGGWPTYRLEPAGPPLRAALIEWLVRELRAEPLPADSDAYEHSVRIGGRQINIAASRDFDYVWVSSDRQSGPNEIVTEIAKRFDAELATGKYDALFGTRRH